MGSRKYTLEQLREAVKNSHSIAACLRLLSVVPAGGNYQVVKEQIKRYQIDTSHFTGKGWLKGKKIGPRRSVEDYLNNAGSITSHKLKKRLIEEGLLEARCGSCGLASWLGRPIPLELHHVDGNPRNNALSNLVLLCPNCHALTGNYRGRKKRRSQESIERSGFRKSRKHGVCKSCGNPCCQRADRCRACFRLDSRKVERPTREELEDLLWRRSTVQLAKDWGVSDTTITKWAKHYGLSKPPRGYWSCERSQR